MDLTQNLIGNLIGIIILIGASIWVFIDAKAIGDDKGQMPGLIYTKPGVWAAGVFLLLIVVLPVYLIVRVRYKRIANERRAQLALQSPPFQETSVDPASTWPPPPQQPTT